MEGQLPPVNSRVPTFALVITTYELVQENGQPIYKGTVTHTFFGDTEDETRRVMQAHAKTDQFFAGSLKGMWSGIVLRNSDPQVFRTGGLTPMK